jgi:uncharacterized protein YuzE
VRVTYDAEADAVYIYLVEIGEVVSGSTINREMKMGAVNADFNAEGQLVGIEVLGLEGTSHKRRWIGPSASAEQVSSAGPAWQSAVQLW